MPVPVMLDLTNASNHILICSTATFHAFNLNTGTHSEEIHIGCGISSLERIMGT